MNSLSDSAFRLFPTLASKLVGILVAFLVLALAAIGLTLLQSWKLEGAAAAINDMGSQRMRAYRIGLLVSEYARGTRSGETAQVIRASLADFEATLEGVKRGDPTRPLFLPKSRDIAVHLDEVESQWRAVVRPAVEAVLISGADVGALLTDFRPRLDRFVAAVDVLVRSIERDNAEATSWLRALQLALVAMAISGTVALIYLMFLLVIRPVSTLCESIQRLQAEDFSARVPVESRDEFGTLARAFNAMAEHLQRLYATLEARVRDKTVLLEAKNRELSTLYAVSTALNPGTGVEEIARAFLVPIVDSFGALGGAVRLRREGDAGLHVIASVGLDESFLSAETCGHAAQCQCGESAAIAQPFVVDDALTRCNRIGFRTVGIFPIRAGRRVLGVYNLYFGETREIADRERRLLEALGHHLATTLESERLRSSEKELAVSEERNLLARELHDSIAQSLAFLNLQAQMLDDSLSKGQIDAARNEVRSIREGVQESYDDVRELLVHFRARVTDADLATGLQQSVARFEGQTAIPTTFETSGDGIELPAEVQLQVLHVIQEALSNVRKHAGASKVRVLMERGPVYRFVVCDDGVGMSQHRPTVSPAIPEQSDFAVGTRT